MQVSQHVCMHACSCSLLNVAWPVQQIGYSVAWPADQFIAWRGLSNLSASAMETLSNRGAMRCLRKMC